MPNNRALYKRRQNGKWVQTRQELVQHAPVQAEIQLVRRSASTGVSETIKVRVKTRSQRKIYHARQIKKAP